MSTLGHGLCLSRVSEFSGSFVGDAYHAGVHCADLLVDVAASRHRRALSSTSRSDPLIGAADPWLLGCNHRQHEKCHARRCMPAEDSELAGDDESTRDSHSHRQQHYQDHGWHRERIGNPKGFQRASQSLGAAGNRRFRVSIRDELQKSFPNCTPSNARGPESDCFPQRSPQHSVIDDRNGSSRRTNSAAGLRLDRRQTEPSDRFQMRYPPFAPANLSRPLRLVLAGPGPPLEDTRSR